MSENQLDPTCYTVMATQGQGGLPVAEFGTLDEALAYEVEHRGEASFGIVYPGGEWHKWPPL